MTLLIALVVAQENLDVIDNERVIDTTGPELGQQFQVSTMILWMVLEAPLWNILLKPHAPAVILRKMSLFDLLEPVHLLQTPREM